MALVNVISKEMEQDLRALTQQLAATAKAAETLLKNLDADRARESARLDRIAKAVQGAL